MNQKEARIAMPHQISVAAVIRTSSSNLWRESFQNENGLEFSPDGLKNLNRSELSLSLSLTKMPFKNLHLLLLFVFLSSSTAAPPSPAIGVTYRHTVPGLPTGDRVVSALRSAGINHVLLPDPDPTTIRSFLYSGISLLLSLPNPLIPDLASNRSVARRWLTDHVLPFHPRVRIIAISVGRDSLSSSLLPAIRKVHLACLDLGLRGIPITTVHSFDVLDPAFPPSAARFQESLSDPYIRTLLDFLSKTGSPFLIDLYPYDLYRSDGMIPIGYAMFEEEAFNFRDDPGSGLRYRNLFDAMVDAAIGAVGKMGHRQLPVVVTGTGWPSGGAREATVQFARRYNGGLVKHVRLGLGTPMRREGAVAVYIHELFDDTTRKGAEWEGHWGIWRANLSKKYEIWLSGSDGGSGNGAFWTVVWGFFWWVLLLPFLI